MAEPVTAQRIGRCPVCLVHMRHPETLRPGSRLKCPKCENSFRPDEVLPRSAEVPAEAVNIDTSQPADKLAASRIQGEQEHNPLVWIATIMFLLAAGVLIVWFSLTLKGPSFLLLYGAVFVITWLATLLIRRTRGDAWSVSFLACLFFLGIGLARFVLGLQAGMHKFGFLWVMMGVGSFLLFVRAKEGEGNRYGFLGTCAIGGSSSSTGCGSSCSSGCGSGCGGCGGCGG